MEHLFPLLTPQEFVYINSRAFLQQIPEHHISMWCLSIDAIAKGAALKANSPQSDVKSATGEVKEGWG